jgi:hypothetical protein
MAAQAGSAHRGAQPKWGPSVPEIILLPYTVLFAVNFKDAAASVVARGGSSAVAARVCGRALPRCVSYVCRNLAVQESLLEGPMGEPGVGNNNAAARCLMYRRLHAASARECRTSLPACSADELRSGAV